MSMKNSLSLSIKSFDETLECGGLTTVCQTCYSSLPPTGHFPSCNITEASDSYTEEQKSGIPIINTLSKKKSDYLEPKKS